MRNVQESQGHTRVQIELANLTDGGFAKLTETIPEGCTCQVLAAAGGVAQIVGNELNILVVRLHAGRACLLSVGQLPIITRPKL